MSTNTPDDDDAVTDRQRAQAQDEDLRVGLGELAGMVTGSRSLEQTLTAVAGFAVGAIPNADGAGVTLLQAGRIDERVEIRVASADFVYRVDDIQYGIIHEGPCISAAAQQQTMRSGRIGSDGQWPRFAAHVAELGVNSALSLPLLLPGQVVGAINVYSYATDAFDDRAAELGESFAGPAAVAVHNAQVLEHARRLAANLQTALTSRAVIDQAIGIIRSRSGGSEQEGFDRLRAISQTQHLKLSEVAQRTVDEAVRRAAARRTGTD